MPRLRVARADGMGVLIGLRRLHAALDDGVLLKMLIRLRISLDLVLFCAEDE